MRQAARVRCTRRSLVARAAPSRGELLAQPAGAEVTVLAQGGALRVAHRCLLTRGQGVSPCGPRRVIPASRSGVAPTPSVLRFPFRQVLEGFLIQLQEGLFALLQRLAPLLPRPFLFLLLSHHLAPF